MRFRGSTPANRSVRSKLGLCAEQEPSGEVHIAEQPVQSPWHPCDCKGVLTAAQPLSVKDQVNAMASDEGSGSFGWFLAGLGIGALVGVLYAPKSGRETRDELVANALDARDKANQLYSQGLEQATQYAQQGKEAATQYVQQGKEVATQYVQQGKEVAGQVVQQGKEVANQYVDQGKEFYDKGRTQWTEYVEKGKGLVQNQTEAAQAAVDAAKDAYTSKTNEAPSGS